MYLNSKPEHVEQCPHKDVPRLLGNQFQGEINELSKDTKQDDCDVHEFEITGNNQELISVLPTNHRNLRTYVVKIGVRIATPTTLYP